MEEREVQGLETLFAQVEDPRVERTKRHRLRDIIILAICGVICGAEGWVEIVLGTYQLNASMYKVYTSFI